MTDGTVSVLTINDQEAYAWSLAIDNMLDCIERGKPLHKIDVDRLKALRKRFNPKPDPFSGREYGAVAMMPADVVEPKGKR